VLQNSAIENALELAQVLFFVKYFLILNEQTRRRTYLEFLQLNLSFKLNYLYQPFLVFFNA